MEQLFDAINSGLAETFFHDVPDFDPERLAEFLGPRVVKTSGKNFALAMHKEDPTDCSDRTEYFDWHSDGLYHGTPPRFVLLHCLDPGTGRCMTDLANVRDILGRLSPGAQGVLRRLRSYYIGHGGHFGHPILDSAGMLLASRGFVSPLETVPLEDVPSIRETSDAFAELYRLLDESAVSIEWFKGATLVFDQRLRMHRRQSAAIDRGRKLIRMWFN
jgi:alpha-ketoglutarate-dependent taurine dioxygenase